MSDTHSRIIIPALGMMINKDDGWSRLEHKIHQPKGWFCWKEAPIYMEYDKGYLHEGQYEKITFEKFSFVEDLKGGFPPNISVDENQIISREIISEDSYRNKDPSGR